MPAGNDPEPFLKGTDDVTVNDTGAWAFILTQEQLTIDATHGKEDVVLDSAANGLGVQFTSEQNVLYFGPSDGVVGGNASIGDSFGSAVLLVVQPKTPVQFALIDKLAKKFSLDVNGDSLSPLTDLLGQLDPKKKLTATLVDQPIVDTSQPPKISQNVNSGISTNAVWFNVKPSSYNMTVTLSYRVTGLDSLASDILDWIASNFGALKPNLDIKTPPINLTLSRTRSYSVDNTQTEAPRTVAKLSFSFNISAFRLYLDLSSINKEIILTPKDGKSIAEMVEAAFGKDQNIDMTLLPNAEGSDPFKSLFDNVHLWYVRVLYNATQVEKQRLQWGIGILAFWKPNGIDIATSLTYDSQSQLFVGRLMFEQDFQNAMDVRLPTWDSRLSPGSILDAEGKTPKNFGQSLDLWKLLGFDSNSQPPIPTKLQNAQVTFERLTGSGSVFSFMADLVKNDTPHTVQEGGAPSGFSWKTAGLDLLIISPEMDLKTPSAPKKAKIYTINVYSTFPLTPPAGSSIAPAYFALGIGYQSSRAVGSSWILQASAQNLSVGLLHSFFDINANPDGAMAVMDKLSLRTLDVIYTYQGGVASSFLMTGILALGELELDLSFQHVSAKLDSNAPSAAAVYLNDNKDGGSLPADPKQRQLTGTEKGDTFTKFVATLRLSSPGATIASIAESIVPGAGDSLPSWVGDIVVNPADATGASPPTAELEWDSVKDGDGSFSVLSIWLSIAGFSFTFVQYQTPKTKSGNTTTNGITKRLVRISVDQIPLMKDIPLVGQLPQPFDNLEYLWVDDETLTPVGITRKELDTISPHFPVDIPPFQIMRSKAQEKDDDIVLAAGHHFIVVAKSQVVLDHVFNTSRAETQDPKKPKSLTGGSTDTEAPPESKAPAVMKTPATPQPTKGKVDTKAGPLSVSGLTFEYKNGFLIVTIDATLTLGPIKFSVIGFEIKIELNKVNLDNLASIITDHLISISLHGIEAGVQQGPLTLKGVFLHDETELVEKYSGGIAVGFEVWQVLAVGQYTITKPTAGKDGYRSVFVYGKLDGPLVELEFATISGVRLGFGYNYSVRMPLLEELHSFPFITDTATQNAGNDPMAVLNAMVGSDKPFVFPKEGSCWFCAGMTIKAFDVLSLTAVLMVDIDSGKADPNEKGVIIALLGDGVFQMPPDAPSPDVTLFYIELIVSVELNFVSGYIAANAVLSPASHVYVPMAHLVGGASFYSWFGNNSHAGEWVISIGGFPRGYALPLYYPDPDRIGLNFTLGDCIQVLGEAYLAVTPKCAMVGGRLHMSLSVGPVSAYCDVVFDAFINFKPFYFKAFVSLSVGVECDIDILFINIHVSIHLGADLTIWGPDSFGGHAAVDFWFFSFGIDFGDAEKDISLPMTLEAFYQQVLTSGPDSAPPTNDKIGDGVTSVQHKFSIEEGLIPTKAPDPDKDGSFPSTGAQFEWQVKAGTLQFRVDTPFALSAAHILSSDPKHPKTDLMIPSANPSKPDEHPTIKPFHSWPMHSKDGNNINSELEVSVFQIDDPDHPVLQHDFRGELVVKSAPVSVWSVYDWTKDPLLVNQPGHLRSADNSTVDLVLGVRILPPLPFRYPSLIVDFDASAAMLATIPGPFAIPLADKPQAAMFSGGYFKPDISDDDVPGQIARWSQLGQIWNPPVKPVSPTTSSDPAKEMTLSDLRSALVEQFAYALEWNFRPSDEMAGNNSIATTNTTTTPASVTAVDSVTALLRTEKLPRINDDGRFDWSLLPEPPAVLASELDTYYPQLPFIVGTPFVASAA